MSTLILFLCYLLSVHCYLLFGFQTEFYLLRENLTRG